MKIIRWAAVAVTALFVLMNLGAAFDSEQETWVQVVGGVLGAAGIPAAVGLALQNSWGRAAVIGVGVLNVAGGIGAVVADVEGGAIGIVVGGLGALLGALATEQATPRAASVH